MVFYWVKTEILIKMHVCYWEKLEVVMTSLTANKSISVGGNPELLQDVYNIIITFPSVPTIYTYIENIHPHK